MFREQNSGARSALVSLFCDPFAAVAAVRQLTTIGLAEHEIDVIGFLGRHAAEWGPLLASLGLPSQQAEFYREEFEDGAFMLVIRTGYPEPKRSAVKVLKQYGGVVPEDDYAGWNRGKYES